MDQTMCKKCGKSTIGYKCDVCGSEADHHDPTHSLRPDGTPDEQHPQGAAHCMPKCVCGQAEAKCVC